MSRPKRLSLQLCELLGELSGGDPGGFAEDVSFLDLGFDSLVLTQVAQSASKKFGVPLKLRDFLEERSTISALARHLDEILPPERADASPPPPPESPAGQAVAVPRVSNAPASSPGAAWVVPPAVATRGPLADLINAQLALMARQLELLSGSVSLRAPGSTAVKEAVASVPSAAQVAEGGSAAPTPQETPAAPSPDGAPPARHGPQLVIDRTRNTQLTPTQQRHLERLFARYGARTARSKEFTQRNRATVADPRVPAGFKLALKEIVYPIVVERSSGCHLWDLDNNEYVDLLNGYGSNFFGYGAPFVRQAISDQLEVGLEIGPQTPLVEEVSALFRQLVPGADRVAFCNTGSEAVLATLRLARTVTGRDKVVMFRGGYHGIFDEVVARGLPGGRSLPAAPGIPREATENLVILDWAADESLTWIREHGDEIAAVLTEPVQSRRPDIVPVDFLRELRAITEQCGAALIFDEVVTGFRVAPGGAQELFGIRADLGSYGKVIGGGLSLGIVAGKREYMDALDGGAWSFGDASIPEVGVTYFAGTFVRHPLHLAAARAVLRKMVAEGPALQRSVSDATSALARDLNALFKRSGAPLELQHFSSVLRVASTTTVPFGELLFAHLRERGVHAWEGRPCFVTAAHEQRDMDFVVAAFRGAIEELQEGGFYPRAAKIESSDSPPVPGARLGRDRTGRPAWFVADPERPGSYRQVESAS